MCLCKRSFLLIFDLPNCSFCESCKSEKIHTLMMTPSDILLQLSQSGKITEARVRVLVVVEGADVLYTGGMNHSSLYNFILMGSVACVRACLESPQALDFSAETIEDGIPRILCSVCYPHCTAVEILQVLVHRLNTHPRDIGLDWGKGDGRGLSFIDLAAVSQRYTSFWPIVKHLPYYDGMTHPIPLHKSWHWECGARRDGCGCSACTPVNGERCPRCIRRVLHARKRERVDVSEASRLVERGMNPLYVLGGGPGDKAALFSLMRRGAVECVRMCLDTTQTFDFTDVCFLLCDSHLSHNTAVAILLLVLCRLESHPQDIPPNWDKRNSYGRTFMDLAAAHQRLSAFWRVVRHLPSYSSATGRIHLAKVWHWDWVALGDDQKYFECSCVVEKSIPRSTARLWSLQAQRRPPVDKREVWELIAEGADPLYIPSHLCTAVSSLYAWVRRSNVECVRACLESPHPLHFVDGGEVRYVLVCDACLSLAIGKDMLRLLVNRVETHPEDSTPGEQVAQWIRHPRRM